jgi:hypothetical protein
MGHHSVADGLAACYMGNNKYLFFSVTTSYEGGDRGLKAYVVDMNEDNGKGKIVDSVEIETSHANMSESVELIAKDGTTNQYWLVYAYCASSCPGNHYSTELRVRPIDVSKTDLSVVGTNGIIGDVAHTATKTPSNTFTLKTSPQHNRIAIANWFEASVDVFDFDNASGALGNHRTHTGMGDAYGVEFSPDGNQLYVARYDGNAHLYQYTISVGALTLVSDIQYWSHAEYTTKGGGLKLGPDGKIYVMLPHSNNVGVISVPNMTTSPSLNDRYNGTAMTLGVTYTGLQFSTGLTRPAVTSCNMNNAPNVRPDSSTICISSSASRTATVNVIANDTDAEYNIIYLTSAEFFNATDTVLAYLTVNPADSTVSLTIKPDAYIGAEGHFFEIIYHVKDNGIPASQCATGILKVTAYPTPNYPDIRVRVCPDAGNVNLAKYIDTADNITAIQWTSRIAGIPISSPAGVISTNSLASARVHMFTYTVDSRCVSGQTRNLYLEVIRNDKVRLPKDTIVVCYKYAEAMQINRLFGIEARGAWSFAADGDVAPYTFKSTSSTYGGAIVMNGRAVYEDSSIQDFSYHGTNAKWVTVTYTPASDANSCLAGKSYSVVIILTQDIIN